MKYIVIKAITSQMLKENNIGLTNEGENIRRCSAINIIDLFIELRNSGIEQAEKMALDAIKEMVDNAVREIEKQDWIDFTEGFEIAKKYLERGY